MNPLQLSGSGNKPSSLEQSTTLDPDHAEVVCVDGGGGGGLGGLGRD